MKNTLELVELDSIMRQDSGRSLLLRILERTGYFESTYSLDPRVSDFKAAQRELGVWLFNEMKQANKGQLLAMIRGMDDD